MNPLVSVIIPVYNVESYVSECIESVIAQTYSNIEIVVVNDGSTDGSGFSCDQYACSDSRVVVVHKENEGLSAARNAGIAVCRGDFVAFVDGDDFVSPVFIETLMHAIEVCDCEIAAIPCGTAFEDGSSCELVAKAAFIPDARVMDSYTVQKLMLYQRRDTGVPWRLYARRILGDAPFAVGLYYEDLASVYKFIHDVDRVALVDCRALYAYRLRKSGIISQAYSPIKALSAIEVSRRLSSDMQEWYPDLAVASASRCFSLCRMVYAQIPVEYELSSKFENDRRALWGELKERRKIVLSDSSARKRERLAAAIALIGEAPFALFCHACRKAGLLR